MIRSKCELLGMLLYVTSLKKSCSDRFFGKMFSIIAKYGGLVVAIWLVIRIFFSSSMEIRNNLIGGLGILASILILIILLVAFEVYFMLPYMLQAYYKWKYPEEYREWEGKSVEEWYGMKYLKKHKELTDIKNEVGLY